MAKPVSAKFVKPTEGSRKRRVFDAFELEGEANAHVLGRRLKVSPASVGAWDLHMDEERRQAGRTQAAAEEGGVIDLIIIALLVLQVILERLF
jgi:hypothetical protein